MATYNSINDYINNEVRGSTSLVPAQGTTVTTFEPSKEFTDLVRATILQARASMNNNNTSGLDELNKNLEEIRDLLKQNNRGSCSSTVIESFTMKNWHLI